MLRPPKQQAFAPYIVSCLALFCLWRGWSDLEDCIFSGYLAVSDVCSKQPALKPQGLGCRVLGLKTNHSSPESRLSLRTPPMIPDTFWQKQGNIEAEHLPIFSLLKARSCPYSRPFGIYSLRATCGDSRRRILSLAV